jgi:hypothetical protein
LKATVVPLITLLINTRILIKFASVRPVEP